ncbi:MAG: N-acetyltransferase [Phycisphaeraceae bacterium]|nr:N-acetyltransferase [Phycisphaeraceae bacterium]
MRVRTFSESDIGPACRITNHYIEQTSVHFGAVPMTEDEFARMWIESRSAYPWLAAEVAGLHGGEASVVGYAKAGVWRARAAYARTSEVSIYLDPGARGQGIGRALYVELLDRLRSAGFHTAVAGATLPNEASARLHHAMGFEFVGVFREVGRKFDRWHDVGWWQKILN